jgi:hypothetical protein
MAEKAEVSLGTSDLTNLLIFAPSPELGDRIKTAETMLKGKFREMCGIDIDSPECQEMMRKTRHWVSSDPKVAEQIRRANDLYRVWTSMAVRLEFSKDELEAFIQRIGDWAYYAEGTKKWLQAALSEL